MNKLRQIDKRVQTRNLDGQGTDSCYALFWYMSSVADVGQPCIGTGL